jgi:hypothetical protein
MTGAFNPFSASLRSADVPWWFDLAWVLPIALDIACAAIGFAGWCLIVLVGLPGSQGIGASRLIGSWLFTYGYVMTVAGVVAGAFFVASASSGRFALTTSIFRSPNLWLGLCAAPIGLGLILNGIGDINLFGLTALALENGLFWIISVDRVLGRAAEEMLSTLVAPVNLDPESRTQDQVRATSWSRITGWFRQLWAGWRASLQDLHRPQAECRVETLSEVTAACVVGVSGTALPIDLPGSILRRAGLKEGDRFRWRIPPDGRLGLGDIARLSDQPRILSPAADRRIDHDYERYRDVSSREIRENLERD